MTISNTANIGGLELPATLTRSATGQESHDLKVSDETLHAAKTGTLSTRTDANTGVITGQSGHGILTGDKIDIYWAGGVQYNVTVGTVSGVSIPIDLGIGDNLPIATTPVTICKRSVIDVGFDGDLVEFLRAVASVAGHIQFQQDDGTHIAAASLSPNEAYDIIDDTNDDNPLAAADVGKIAVSLKDTGTTGTFKLGILYNSVS